MKAILPILICSTITGALGYYFGHITMPADSQAAAPETTASTPVFATKPATPDEAPRPAAPAAQSEVTTPAPTSTSTAATTPEPASQENAFAARAAKTTQTLTDTQGRTIQASIVRVMDSEVKILRSDGLETSIPLNMLSDEDVAFCNYLREQQEAEPVKTPDTSDGFDWDAYFNT